MANAKFKIADQEYEFPKVDDFNMDEWEILYDYSQLIYDDFALIEDEERERERQRLISQPGYLRALLHIGYRRAHPDAAAADIKKITGEAKLSHIFDAEYDADPPDLATASESVPESSPSGSGSESSGSPVSSDEPESPPAPTGTPV